MSRACRLIKWIGLAALGLLSSCDRSPLPPNEPGVCWRADFRSLKEPSFTVAATDAPNIVSCAADLELAYLTEKQAITGAYQGYYIFVGPAAVTGAQRLNFIRYPVLNKAERAMIDARLREFIAARAS